MTQEVAQARVRRPGAPVVYTHIVPSEEPTLWTLRGIQAGVKRRMIVQANLRGVPVGQLANLVLLGWLDDGAVFLGTALSTATVGLEEQTA